MTSVIAFSCFFYTPNYKDKCVSDTVAHTEAGELHTVDLHLFIYCSSVLLAVGFCLRVIRMILSIAGITTPYLGLL